MHFNLFLAKWNQWEEQKISKASGKSVCLSSIAHRITFDKQFCNPPRLLLILLRTLKNRILRLLEVIISPGYAFVAFRSHIKHRHNTSLWLTRCSPPLLVIISILQIGPEQCWGSFSFYFLEVSWNIAIVHFNGLLADLTLYCYYNYKSWIWSFRLCFIVLRCTISCRHPGPLRLTVPLFIIYHSVVHSPIATIIPFIRLSSLSRFPFILFRN